MVINILFDNDILHSIHLQSISKPETKRLVGGQSQSLSREEDECLLSEASSQ